MGDTTIHASAVLVGAKAVLISGPSGSGKSRLVLSILQAAADGKLPFARLIADDRVYLTQQADRLIVRSVPSLAGLLEVRGVGVRRMEYEALGVVGLVMKLGELEKNRLPDQSHTEISGVRVPWLGVPAGADAFQAYLAWRNTVPMRD